MNADVTLMIENVIHNKNGIMIKVNVGLKNQYHHRVCEENYA